MASSTATLSAVLTLDDRASPGLVRTSQNADELRNSMLSLGGSMASFSSSMASLLVTTGALESRAGSLAAAWFGVAGALFSLIEPLVVVNRLLRTNATIQAFLSTLTRGPVGLALLGVAGTAAVGTAAFLASRAVNNSFDERNRLRGEQQQTVHQTIDLRGATIRGEDDLNELSRRVSQSVPPRF